MLLSIVILNYKSAGLLRQCLKSIDVLRLPFEHEVIVVDNASHDGCAEMVKKLFPSVHCIQSEKNLGYAGGNNLGLRAATGEYILVINPDILMLTTNLGGMIDYLRAHPEIGILGPKLINPDGSLQYSCYRFPGFFMPFYRRTFIGTLPGFRQRVGDYLMQDWDHQHTRPVDWILGGCFLMPRSALQKIGYLDERFFMYFDDIDYCRRAWESGFQVVYYAESEVVHYHQRTSADRSWLLAPFHRVSREHIKSWLKYFAKYFGVKKPRHG